MTTLKTIAATAVIAVAGTVAAFSGLHLGQSPADAATGAQPAKAKPTYTVTLTAKDLAKLATMMNGRQDRATVRATAHHTHQAHHQRHATHHTAYRATTRSGSSSSQRSGSGSGSRCYGHSHRGDRGRDSGHHCGDSGDGDGGCW